MYGVIYLITNLDNEKKYVGQTVAGLKRRWQKHVNEALRGSMVKLQRAIRKHGSNRFISEVIHVCENKPEMDFVEMFYIAFLKTQELGYNVTSGGDGSVGTKHSEESKEKIRRAHLGKKMPPFSEEAKRNIGLARFGRKHSEETKRKMRIAAVRGYANGRIKPCKDLLTGRFVQQV